jgi:hypothetical protein
MSCTICQHSKRQEIDQALMAGSATLAALSQEHGLSTSALHRHKGHLQAKVNRAKDQLQDNLRQGCIFWLSQALEMAMATAQAAQTEGNFKVVLQALGHGTRIINIILKQDFQLDSKVVFGVLASDQWATRAGLLPHDPQIMALSRQSLTGTLATPCPDNEPDAPSTISPEDLDLLQQNLLSLAQQVVQPQTSSPKLAHNHRLGQQREKGGKLPGKTPSSTKNDEKNQEDKLYEKILRIMDQPFLAGNLSPATLNPVPTIGK